MITWCFLFMLGMTIWSSIFEVTEPATGLVSHQLYTHTTGWWFGSFLLFSYIGNFSSSQLTNSIIFQRGRSTTNQIILQGHTPWFSMASMGSLPALRSRKSMVPKGERSPSTFIECRWNHTIWIETPLVITFSLSTLKVSSRTSNVGNKRDDLYIANCLYWTPC